MNEYIHLNRILSELKEIMQREDKRHEMDQHLTPSMYALLENEIIPMIENELDYDPTDDMGGEPPMTAAEIHHAAWVQRQSLRLGVHVPQG
jgi:hypothetical protein